VSIATRNWAGTYTGIVSGAGFLVVGDGVNKGTVVLSGANSYFGGTLVLGGATLSVGNDGNLATLSAGGSANFV
jgi:autotransporter-associated beta strand protein